MDRRTVLKLGAGAAAAAVAFPFSRSSLAWLADVPIPFVRDDIGRLRSVLVHSPTEDEYAIDQLGGGLIPDHGGDIHTAMRQHASLLRLLRESGAETIELADALAGAIDHAKSRGDWKTWLSTAHPRLSRDADRVTADTLLGRDRSYQYQAREDGTYQNLFSDTSSTMWTRDASFMTPRGLVVCNSASRRRLRENMTLRFTMSHSPMLHDYPIVFDAVAEGVVIEGGDAQMVDEKMLFLGTGQRTDPRAAPMLARRLNMDVVAVQVHKTDFLNRATASMGSGAVSQLRVHFLHLDTFFTHVNHGHVLTVPWLLEKEHAGKDPISRYIEGARAEKEVKPEDAAAGLEFLKEFGKVTVYSAGTGEKQELPENTKLVDYIKEQGYKVTYVGDQEPDQSAEAFSVFLRDTLGELRRQASNVVATAPGRVIAYDGSPKTKAALERDGVTVSVFEARELWAGHGGPHCLTMPLRRD